MRSAVLELLRAPRVTATLSTTGAGLVAIAFTVQQVIGWPGYIAAFVLLSLLLLASLLARRDELDWHWAILPISLVAYLAWLGLSVFWSDYQRVTLSSLGYLLLVTFTGVFIALSRDTIQIIRSFGDVFRALLVVSIALETLSGIIFDAPLAVLNIRAALANGGPISGLVADRNQLGLVAAIAVVTFAIEWRTRSITRAVALASLALAAGTLVFTRSPVVVIVTVVLLLAGGVLYGIRRLPAERRQLAQYAVLAVLAIGAVVTWIFRAPIIGLFNATGELEFRLVLWQEVLQVVPVHWLEGWGWSGIWNATVPPYAGLTPTMGRSHDSALNAVVDLWLQVGVVGIVLFLAVVGLAFTRSWLLAGRRRSVVHTWPALVLVALVVVSVAESSILTEFGWLLLTICCVKASSELSWRRALSPIAPTAGDTGANHLPQP
ncbi:O-antigen ligase family protein [Pseudolysinimonas sp.]|uniref:O-antigen ligase family protein n=1 Tax=Pseudolysinimonas sp. TaxID=2680009 RepID=UPI003783D890